MYFENTHYLGADKDGEKPYRLLAEAIVKSGRVAIAELVSRGKEQLVLIRPYRKGLVLHTMYHGDEVRDFKQVPKGEKVNVSKQERELGVGLIDRLTQKSSSQRTTKMSIASASSPAGREEQRQGHHDVGVSPERGKVVDIMEALKRSIERIPAKKKPATTAVTKKKKTVS